MPLVSRTRATLRSAEFGFFGVWVKTRTQTPRFCGLFCNAGLLVLLTIFFRPARTSWLMVGINLKKRGTPLCWSRAPQTETAAAVGVPTAHAGVPLPESLQAWKPQGLAPENLSYPMLVMVAATERVFPGRLVRVSKLDRVSQLRQNLTNITRAFR